jgi:hypothetical protein
MPSACAAIRDSGPQFDGWASRDEAVQFAWDLLFYEPWFLGLAVLVTLTTTAALAALCAQDGGSWPSPPWRRFF